MTQHFAIRNITKQRLVFKSLTDLVIDIDFDKQSLYILANEIVIPNSKEEKNIIRQRMASAKKV